jgi:nucleotide-binding universal stress UspA family protein
MTDAFAKILMATDFRAESDAALRSCTSLARGLGASIHLLHVAKDPIVAVGNAELYPIDWATLREGILEEALRRLDATASSLPGLRVTIEAVMGSPAEVIAERAQDLGVNLIVMGTHGRGGVGHLLLGSVAERVIRLAPCPVMTVRGSGAVKVRAGERAVAVPEPAHVVS